MRLVIDYQRCQGVGICQALMPAVFDLNALAQAVALVNPVPDAALDAADDAVASCPTEALTLVP
jgi:ferredoxin